MININFSIFSVLIVISAAVIFDFAVFIIKSAPKSSYFTKPTWVIGALSTMALVYWFLNGMSFII